jgi:hypothetical protein
LTYVVAILPAPNKGAKYRTKARDLQVEQRGAATVAHTNMPLKLFAGLLLFASAFAFAEEADNMRDITAKLPVDEFKGIVRYILEKGDRRTYSSKYNNSPHYRIKGLDIYLNPKEQDINFLPSRLSYNTDDYNEIVIVDQSKYDEGFLYSFIYLRFDKVYILNVYRLKKQKEYERNVITRYLPLLKGLIKETK